MLYDTHAAEIDALLARYADKRSAVLPLLFVAQDAYGSLTQEAVREVADTLNMPYTDVFEVVGFYTLFYSRPVGKWMLQVCDDVPCCYLGAEELVNGLKQRLGIREEQTTSDGMFTLQRVKCLASCDKAPLLQANLDYVYNVTPDKIDDMLRDLRARAASPEGLSVSGRLAEDYDAVASQGLRIIQRQLGDLAPVAQGDVPAPAVAEEQKAEAETEASVPEEPAKAAAEERIAEESPVAPSPDRSPAGERPVEDKQDDHGTVPARPMQQNPALERSDSADETTTESARGWRQVEPAEPGTAATSAAAVQPPAESSPEPSSPVEVPSLPKQNDD